MNHIAAASCWVSNGWIEGGGNGTNPDKVLNEPVVDDCGGGGGWGEAYIGFDGVVGVPPVVVVA